MSHDGTPGPAYYPYLYPDLRLRLVDRDPDFTIRLGPIAFDLTLAYSSPDAVPSPNST